MALSQLRMTVPTVVLAQAWRGNSALVARCLAVCEIEAFTEPRARSAGELLGKCRTNDIVDAAVVLSAASRGDLLVTSDAGDLECLARAAGTEVALRAVADLAIS